VFWDKFVLEYVVREFLLLVLLLYQFISSYLGSGGRLRVRPTTGEKYGGRKPVNKPSFWQGER
jgi:hypothetical protein